MRENPGAYNEARNRIHENQEKEKRQKEAHLQEHFEKEKATLRMNKKIDIFTIRRKIETGVSLLSLKNEITRAFHQGDISKETFQALNESLEKNWTPRSPKKPVRKETTPPLIPANELPFSQNAFAKYLENTPLGENLGTDIVGFLYGFFVQGSTLLIILAWRILVDLLKLPYDSYQEIKRIPSQK